MKTAPTTKLYFSGPARYRIKIKGKIPSSLTEILGDFNINVRETHNGLYETTLEGNILDQAGLVGVLSMIYSLHIPLIEVRYLEEVNNEGILT